MVFVLGSRWRESASVNSRRGAPQGWGAGRSFPSPRERVTRSAQRVAPPAAGGQSGVSAESGQSSRWGRGARLTRRAREEPPPGELARVYFDRSATMSRAERGSSAGMHRRSLPERGAGTPERRGAEGPGDPGAGREPRVDPGAEGAEGGAIRPPLLLARASGAGREPRVDPGAEGAEGGAIRPPLLLARASGAGREPRVDPGAEGAEGGAIRPPLLLARECHGTLSTGCLPVGKAPGIPETPPALSCLAYLRDAGRFVHGRSTACGGARVSAESGQSSRWGRGTRLTRRVREEPPPGELARVYFDRNATQSAAKRQFSRWGGGSGGMDRRSNAAWVSPQAVNRRTRRGR